LLCHAIYKLNGYRNDYKLQQHNPRLAAVQATYVVCIAQLLNVKMVE